MKRPRHIDPRGKRPMRRAVVGRIIDLRLAIMPGENGAIKLVDLRMRTPSGRVAICRTLAENAEAIIRIAGELIGVNVVGFGGFTFLQDGVPVLLASYFQVRKKERL